MERIWVQSVGGLRKQDEGLGGMEDMADERQNEPSWGPLEEAGGHGGSLRPKELNMERNELQWQPGKYMGHSWAIAVDRLTFKSGKRQI